MDKRDWAKLGLSVGEGTPVKVPGGCPVCGSACKGGSAAPGEAMSTGRRVFYDCGASLCVSKAMDGAYLMLVKNCGDDPATRLRERRGKPKKSVHRRRLEKLYENGLKFALSFKDLRELVDGNRGVPDDAVVAVERIEDVYFEKHHWKTIPVKDGLNPASASSFHIASSVAVNKEKDVVFVWSHY